MSSPHRVPAFPDIEDHVPYVQAVGPYLQDRYGCTHLFVELAPPALDTLGVERLVAMQSAGSALLEALPEEIVQIQISYATCEGFLAECVAHAKFASAEHPLLNLLRADRAERLIRQCHDRELVKATILMVLSAAPDPGGWIGGNGRAAARNASPRPRAVTRESTLRADEILRTSLSIAADVLGAAGIGTRAWTSEEIADHLYHLFNPGLAQDLPVRYDYDSSCFNDAWLVQNWELRPDCWCIGAPPYEFHHGFVSLVQPPVESVPRTIEQITTGSGVRALRVVHNIRRLDKAAQTADIKFRLQKSVKAMEESTSILDRITDPRKKVDPGLQRYSVDNATRADDLASALAELQTGAEYQVESQLIIHTWAETKARLDEQRSRLLARVAEMGSARGVIENFPTFPVFRSALPGSMERMPRSHPVRSRMAIDLSPLSAGFRGGDEPLCVFRTPSAGLVTLDLFGKRNVTAPLAFVSGGSGSGKSFLMILLILQTLVENALGLILDVGGSYRRLVTLLGGKVLEFRIQTPFCFNPLQVYGADGGGALRIPSPLDRARIVTCLEPLLVQPDDPGGLLPVEMLNELDAAVESAFRETASSGENLVTLSTLHGALGRYPKFGPALASRMLPFLKGQEYGEWFDGPTSVDLRSNLIAFDLQGIKKDRRLCAAMTPVIVNYMHDMVVRNRDRRKLVVMDEMWDLVTNEHLVQFIIEAWKTFRKEDCVTIGCSQSLGEDIADTPVGAAVIANTQTWFLLPQGKADQIRRAQQILGLNEGQTEVLKNLRARASPNPEGRFESYRTALMIRGATTATAESGAIQIEATPMEYWIATTEPAEIRLFNETVAAFDGSLSRALDYLSARHPHGLLDRPDRDRAGAPPSMPE